MKAVILLSGGIDSMACIHFYRDLGYSIDCIFFDYGQPAKENEYDSAKKITEYFNNNLLYINGPDISIESDGEIIGRNALFVFATLSRIKNGCYKIILGIHSGTSYIDCTKVFVEYVNKLIDLYSGGQIILEAPFIAWTKQEIIEYAKMNHLPIELTYSCERGGSPPCGKCLSCLDRKEFLDE